MVLERQRGITTGSAVVSSSSTTSLSTSASSDASHRGNRLLAALFAVAGTRQRRAQRPAEEREEFSGELVGACSAMW